MDALRLIRASRGALARSHDPPDILAEAWQAQALAQAIGSRLAVSGPPELRGEALGLTEVSGRGCAALDAPDLGVNGIRAAQLTSIEDARIVLLLLGGLLGEVGIALVGVACSAGSRRTTGSASRRSTPRTSRGTGYSRCCAGSRCGRRGCRRRILRVGRRGCGVARRAVAWGDAGGVMGRSGGQAGRGVHGRWSGHDRAHG